MSNEHIAEFDAKILTVSLECTVGELRPIVGDDPIQDLKLADDGLDELDCGLLVDLDHSQPPSELIDGDV
jgi:hypothetical protein